MSGMHSNHPLSLAGRQYMYKPNLLAIAACCPHLAKCLPYGPVPSPLKIPARETPFQQHPEQEFMTYILQGIHDGFSIGFHPLSLKTTSQISTGTVQDGDAPGHGMVRCLRCTGLWCLHYAGMVSWSLAKFMVPGEHYCQGTIINCAGVSDMGSTVIRKKQVLVRQPGNQ